MKRTNRKYGFSLVEMMVSVGIFSVVLSAVLYLFVSGTKTYHRSVAAAQMRFRTQKAISEMKAELADARILDGANLLDQISFQRPTAMQQADLSNHYINTSTMSPFWGDGETDQVNIADDHIDLNGDGFPRITFQFMQDSLLNESADNIDYNLDGDQLDVFERGRIVRIVRDSSQAIVSQRNLTTDWVFKAVLPRTPPPSLSATEMATLDVDNLDGLDDDPDPLFMIVDDNGDPNDGGWRVQVKVFTMEFIDRVPRLVSYETTVTSVNK